MAEPAENDQPVTAPVRKKTKVELGKQRKHEVTVDGVVVSRWSEPRLCFDDDAGSRVGVFDDVRPQPKVTMADRLAEADRHRVTGALLAHTGATCGGCRHFKLRGRDGVIHEPGAIGVTGMPVMGYNVCAWAAPITRSHPRTGAGEPACVHHEGRADGSVVKPTMRPVACHSCGAPAVWCNTGKGRMLVDPSPVEDGNIEIVRWHGNTPVIAVHGPSYEWPEGVDRFVSHFATCPNADKHRKGAI